MTTLSGKVAAVTGGSKGLGKAIAADLLRAGAAVALCARTEAELAATARELEPLGPVSWAATDVTDADALARFIDGAAQRHGGLDILVNNAGRARPGNFETLTDEDWRADLDVKLFSMIRGCRSALSHMRARGGGRIVNINAVYGKMPDPAFFATSVNRAACLAFTKTLAIQLAPENILVNSVNIGVVRTPQWERIHRLGAPDEPEDAFYARMAAGVPLGRFGTPEEVAGLVAFLCGDRASYITGASIDVAGGMGRYV